MEQAMARKDGVSELSVRLCRQWNVSGDLVLEEVCTH